MFIYKLIFAFVTFIISILIKIYAHVLDNFSLKYWTFIGSEFTEL